MVPPAARKEAAVKVSLCVLSSRPEGAGAGGCLRMPVGLVFAVYQRPRAAPRRWCQVVSGEAVAVEVQGPRSPPAKLSSPRRRRKQAATPGPPWAAEELCAVLFLSCSLCAVSGYSTRPPSARAVLQGSLDGQRVAASLSSSLTISSKVKPYWKPEQPPP